MAKIVFCTLNILVANQFCNLRRLQTSFLQANYQLMAPGMSHGQFLIPQDGFVNAVLLANSVHVPTIQTLTPHPRPAILEVQKASHYSQSTNPVSRTFKAAYQNLIVRQNVFWRDIANLRHATTREQEQIKDNGIPMTAHSGHSLYDLRRPGPPAFEFRNFAHCGSLCILCYGGLRPLDGGKPKTTSFQ